MKITEHAAQCALIKWFRIRYPKISNTLFAIPNGGKRNIGVAVKLKQEGTLSGVSDLFLMVSRGTYHGAFIEMKTEKGRLSEPQKKFLELAKQQGYFTIVGYGFMDAKKQVEDYLKSE